MHRSVFLAVILFGVHWEGFCQTYTHSVSLGINYSFHKISNNVGMDFENINGKAILDLNNNFSFQNKQLSDRSSFFSTIPSKLDFTYHLYRKINPRFYLGSGLQGSGRNYVITEYPIERSTGFASEMPANRLYRRYYNLALPLFVRYNYSGRFWFRGGLNLNYTLLRSFETAFYQTEKKQALNLGVFLGMETRLFRNYHAYLQWNQGFNKIFNDQVILYSPTAYGYPVFKASCYSYGNNIQFGFTRYFDPQESIRTLQRKGYLPTKKVLAIEAMEIELKLKNENNGQSRVDLWVDKELLESDFLIDSTERIIRVRLNPGKKCHLHLISKDRQAVITNISIAENQILIDKYIWKPDTQKSFYIKLKQRF